MEPLSIPEILTTVCYNLDKPSLRRAILVSRLWSEVCRRLLWRHCSFTAEDYNAYQATFEDNAHLINAIEARYRLLSNEMRFIAHHCPNLKVLTLVNCHMTAANLDALCGGIPNVETLTLDHCAGVNSRVSSYLARLPKLSNLSILVHAQQRGEGDWREEDMVVLLTQCPLLSLRIRGPELSHIHLNGLKRLPASLRLKHLYIISTFISQTALSIILQKSPQLATLVLLHNAIKNSTAQTIAKDCTTLTHLNLRLANSVSTSGFEAVFKRNQWLRHLDISHTMINDAALSCLAHHCSRIETLNLAGCTRLTHVGFWEVIKSLADLQDLCLGGCARLKVLGLSGEDNWACKESLRVLDISNVGLRLDDQLDLLVGHLLSLRRLQCLTVDANLVDTLTVLGEGDVQILPAAQRER
ncbi:hypothetical protein BGZ94_005590, partial [Podila epigama]